MSKSKNPTSKTWEPYKPVCIDLSGDPTRPKPGTPEYSAMIGDRVKAFDAAQKDKPPPE